MGIIGSKGSVWGNLPVVRSFLKGHLACYSVRVWESKHRLRSPGSPIRRKGRSQGKENLKCLAQTVGKKQRGLSNGPYRGRSENPVERSARVSKTPAEEIGGETARDERLDGGG